jgi:hypothetical protein
MRLLKTPPHMIWCLILETNDLFFDSFEARTRMIIIRLRRIRSRNPVPYPMSIDCSVLACVNTFSSIHILILGFSKSLKKEMFLAILMIKLA